MRSDARRDGLVVPLWHHRRVFETNPPPPLPDGFAADGPDGLRDLGDLSDLDDPVSGVVAEELSRRFVGLCLSWAEPMTADLAAQESMLRKPGGPELAGRMFAQRLYHRFDPQVFRMLRVCVPLAHAEFALSRAEEMLREQFGAVVSTIVSFLLSHDRDVAIQMAATAATMGAREVRQRIVAIIADTHRYDDDH